MNIPQLQIQTTPSKLDLQTTNAVQEIEQPRAVLSQQQPAAILEISTTRPQLSLDTTELRAELDLKSPLRRSAENAQYGQSQVMEGIARRASEGQQLAAIENGGNAIVNITKQYDAPEQQQIGIRFVGNRLKLQMSIQPGTLTVNTTPQKVVNDVQVNKPIHTFTPGKVTGEMEQYGSIHIDWKI